MSETIYRAKLLPERISDIVREMSECLERVKALQDEHDKLFLRLQEHKKDAEYWRGRAISAGLSDDR